MACSSAAATTSASRSEPPGWITAVAPAFATTSRPSRNGKNASDAHTVPAVSRPTSRARMTARRAREVGLETDRKSTRLNSSHDQISYAVFCLKKKKLNSLLHLHDPDTLSRYSTDIRQDGPCVPTALSQVIPHRRLRTGQARSIRLAGIPNAHG